MSGEAPDSGEAQAPTSPAAAVQPPASGTNDGALHASGHVHAHHSAIQFRFLEQLKHHNVIQPRAEIGWSSYDPPHANTVRTQLFRVGAPDLRAGRSDACREPAARGLQSVHSQGIWP